jgi:predicted nucleotidyltransferase
MLINLLLKVVKELDKNKIPYIIIGGQAVNLHGIVRATQDIDITLGIDTGKMEELLKIILKLNLIFLKENPEEFAKKFWVMPVFEKKSKIKIDFAFSFSPFEKNAIKRAVKIKIKNQIVKFCSIEDLIVFKVIAGRAIDLFDVRNIILRNGKFDRKYVLKWIKLFEDTTGENYKKILEKIIISIK